MTTENTTTTVTEAETTNAKKKTMTNSPKSNKQKKAEKKAKEQAAIEAKRAARADKPKAEKPKAEKKAKADKKAKAPRAIPAITPHSTEYSVNPDHSRYTWAQSPVKGLVYDNGDQVAMMFRAMTLAQCYDYVEAVIVKSGRPYVNLRAKYAHLNTGMQRMNLGNVIRGLAKSNPALITKPMRIKEEKKILAAVIEPGREEPIETLV